MRALAAILVVLLAAPLAAAQSPEDPGTIEAVPLDDPTLQPLPPEARDRDLVEFGTGVVLRALDKVSGEVIEFPLRPGETMEFGRIDISAGECRFPRGNPAGDAFAWIEVRTPSRGTTDFQGWMIASSPALNALDNARYDVWVMRCISA
jgi:hypothetical protein